MSSSGVCSLIKWKHDFTLYLASGKVPDHIPGSSWTFAKDLHLQVNHRCSRDGKLSCFSVRTVSPAGNFNSGYNSLEIKRSYGPVLAAGSQLEGSPLSSPSQAVEAQQHSSVCSWLPCTLHWLQDLSSVGEGCDIWLTERYEQLLCPLPEGSGPDGNTLQAELGLWITSSIFYPIKTLEAQTSLSRLL